MYFTPFRTVVLFMAASLVGLMVTDKLSVNLVPDYSLPQLHIQYSVPGGSPEFVEQEATAPLENSIAGVADIKHIQSVSNYNGGYIHLEFDEETDIDFRKFEIASIIRRAYPSLHPSVRYPEISRQGGEDDSKSPLLVFRVNGPDNSLTIKKYLEGSITQSIRAIPGVDQVLIRGSEEEQVTVLFNPTKLNRYGLSIHQCMETINQYSRTLDFGWEQVSEYEGYYRWMSPEPWSIEKLKNLHVRNDFGKLIPINEVATVALQAGEPKGFFRINGLNSITATIYADQGVNRLSLAQKLRDLIYEIEVPQGYQVMISHDDSEYLNKELHKLSRRAVLSLLILVLFVLVLHRNWRYLVILFSGILVNLSLTILACWLLNIPIHLYTLAGLTISLGLIIDNAIVITDHIRKKSKAKIFNALFAASITTIAALSILFFLPKEERQNLTEFAWIISCALGISLVVALWYTPAIFQLVYRQGEKPRKKNLRLRIYIQRFYFRIIGFLMRYKKLYYAFLILLFGLPVFLLPPSIEGKEWYNDTLGSDYYQETIRPIADKVLGGTLRLFVRNVYEKYVYRTPEETKLYIQASLPIGNTPDQMNGIIERMEQYILEFEGIKNVLTTVYSGQNASIIITFKEQYDRGSLPYILKNRTIARSLDWGGVKWNIYGVGKGFSNKSMDEIPSYRVMMKGFNYEHLAGYSDTLARALERHKRVQNVNTNQKMNWSEKSSVQYVMHIDQQKLGMQGGSGTTIRTELTEKTPPTSPSGVVKLGNDMLPLYFISDEAGTFSTFNLMNEPLLISGDSLYSKPSSFSSLSFEKTTNAIHKEDRRYLRIVGFDYFGSHKFGSEYLDKVLREMETALPPGYEAKKSDYDWNMEKVKRQYGLLLVLIVAIYFICTILFENFHQAFVVILIIPVSFIGLFLTFVLFDLSFDQGGYAAFIMLGGLVVNAALFIINDYNAYAKPSLKNLIKAMGGKAIPILLTVFSTCFGLLPFLVGGQEEVFWFSLAAGTIGGLIFSLFAVFFVLPVKLKFKTK